MTLRRFGLGLVSPHAFAYATAIADVSSVTIDFPAPATQFLIGVPTTVSGTCVGGTVALTWAVGAGSAGTVTYTTDTTWTCDVTATTSDAAEVGLVATRGGATDTLAITVAYPMPWLTADCIGYWSAPPHGTQTVDGGNLVELVTDMQPASSYPAGKTGPYHLTAAGADRPLYSAGAWDANGAQRKLGCSVAEMMAFVDGDDIPMTMLCVMKPNSNPIAASHLGLYWEAGNQWRMTYQTAGSPNCVRYGNGGVGLVQIRDAGYTGADKHVWLIQFSGTHITLYDESGIVTGPSAADVGALVMTTFKLWINSGQMWEAAIWARSLTSQEISDEIGRAAVRQSVPF